MSSKLINRIIKLNLNVLINEIFSNHVLLTLGGKMYKVEDSLGVFYVDEKDGNFLRGNEESRKLANLLNDKISIEEFSIDFFEKEKSNQSFISSHMSREQEIGIVEIQQIELIDHYAGLAMQSFIKNLNLRSTTDTSSLDLMNRISKYSFVIAKQMIEERKNHI